MSVTSSRTKEEVILGMGVFTEQLLVTRRCANALVEVLKEMNREKFTELEIDTVISKILHVFQSKDVYLKILCYSFIRSTAELSSGSFVAINALINSINQKKSGMRSESLRLLLQITPEQMLEDCSKYVQQSLIEGEYTSLEQAVPVLLFVSSPSISEWFSSAGWIGGLSGKSAFGNAILLMEKTRGQDSRELVKTVGSAYLKGCSAVVGARYLAKQSAGNPQALKRLESFFRLDGTDEIAFIEAVRTIGWAGYVNSGELVGGAIRGLKKMLGSQKFSHRVAALRTVEMLSATQHKNKLVALRGEVEEMLGSGSTCALIAMGVLLRIGTETMAEKISKQLPKMMNEMGEGQKISLIESAGQLCEKFSSVSWAEVLQSALNSSSTCSHKVKVVQVVSKVAKNTKSEELRTVMEKALAAYIEDSPYPRVTVEILGVLLGNRTEQYTVCLMNRMVLDDENVCPAIDLALASGGVGRREGPLERLFLEGVESNEHILSNAGGRWESRGENEIDAKKNRILVRARELLDEEAAAVFEAEKRKASEMETAFGSEEMRVSRPVVLNRTESEFLISVTKHTFAEFIVLKYVVTSKIEFVLEEGRLCVFLEGEKIDEQKIYLRGKESKEIFVKIGYSSFEDILDKGVGTTFGYSVNDNRDYEVGELRLNAFGIAVSDFIAPTEEEYEGEEGDTERKEFKFSSARSEVVAEMKKIFDIPVMEEDGEEFLSKGVFIFTMDPVLIRVKTKEAGSKTKAEVSVCTRNERLRKLLIGSIG